MHTLVQRNKNRVLKLRFTDNSNFKTILSAVVIKLVPMARMSIIHTGDKKQVILSLQHMFQ